MFLVAMGVQYNDPDALIWVYAYAYAAGVTGLAIFGRYTLLAAPGVIGYLIGFYYLMPRHIGNYLEDEAARESGGALISAIWMIVLSAAWYREMKRAGRPTAMHVMHVFMFVVFLICIAVQYNDPDGLAWSLIYTCAAVVTACAALDRYSALAIPAAVGYLAGFAYLMPHYIGNYLEDEVARESGGVLIAAIWMIVIAVGWHRRRRRTDPSTRRTS